MPIQRAKTLSGETGWRWGGHGKIYRNKSQAIRQMRAAFANGYRQKHANIGITMTPYTAALIQQLGMRKKAASAASIGKTLRRALTAMNRGFNYGRLQRFRQQLPAGEPLAQLDAATVLKYRDRINGMGIKFSDNATPQQINRAFNSFVHKAVHHGFNNAKSFGLGYYTSRPIKGIQQAFQSYPKTTVGVGAGLGVLGAHAMFSGDQE